MLHDRSGEGEVVVLCVFGLILLLIENIGKKNFFIFFFSSCFHLDENQRTAKKMRLWKRIEISQESYFSSKEICSLYIKILSCLVEPRDLIPDKDKPDGNVMSIALALRTAFDDPGTCQAGLSLLQALSINCKNNRAFLIQFRPIRIYFVQLIRGNTSAPVLTLR